MKYLLYILFISIALSSCNNKTNPDSYTVSEDQISKVEEATAPASVDQFKSPRANGDFLFAVKLFIVEGKIVRDSSSLTRVPGKFDAGLERSDFRIEAKSSNNELLGTMYTENIFKIRSCDEEGKTGYVDIPKGWIEIYLPANPRIASVDFLDAANKDRQSVDIQSLIKKAREQNQNKEK